MPVHVEFSTASGHNATVENGLVEQSEAVLSGGVSFAAPSDGFFTVTPTEDGYVSFSPGTPSALADPRRRVLAGAARSFAVPKGMKLAFTAG